ncbi:MAG: hypothetical protein J7K30_00820 [Deltaproteobacteria bacterium]|nr:hypothetical protein [Deltaproteobacteria bacterium]
MKNRFNFTALFFFLLILFAGNSLYAVETAPRISDREIIESLEELKAGQKALKESMEARFVQVDKRFEQVNSHFGQMYNLVLSLFGSLIVLIIAVLGYSMVLRSFNLL